MPEIDFAMTYPCYFLLKQNGEPDWIVSESGCCICLFTDWHLAETFYKDRYGVDLATRPTAVMIFENQKNLTTTLAQSERQLAETGLRHLAIDATPKKPVATSLIRDFIEGSESRN